MTRLHRVDCTGPGLTRRRCGRGWLYADADGRRIADPVALGRIAALAVPPAWTDVWICPSPNGHLQAVGTDAKGRRQYRYHDAWRRHRDREKYDHMVSFARLLPDLRVAVAADLEGDGLSEKRVLACAARLLDVGFFRIGGETYAEENNTFGLATVQRRHVRVVADGVVFDYEAKHGRRRVQEVVDEQVREMVTTLKRRRGGSPDLLAWKGGGRWHDVRSADINAYLKDHLGSEVTAKDFRTWNATLLAAVALAVSWPAAASATARKRAVARAVQEVAYYLGNTPAVCRSAYIDPRIVDAYQAGMTIEPVLGDLGDGGYAGLAGLHGTVEQAVIDLLDPPTELAEAA